MQRLNPHDQWEEKCRNHNRYPKDQLKTQQPHEIILVEQLFEAFDRKREATFAESKANIDFWETGRQNKFPNAEDTKTVSNVSALQRHLNRAEEDPHVRHSFIGCNDSRSALNCSAEMFTYLCSYHQVDPSFLESVFAFGKQSEPIDLCLAQFVSSGTLKSNQQVLPPLPRLGRSGREIQISYLLRTIERSNNGKGIWKWQVRQAANYHSFDIQTGHTFWLTIKANDLFRQRIRRVASSLNIPSKAEVEKNNVSPYFKASLATHLVYLSWCDDGWREFINEVEDAMRNIRRPASNALIDDHISPEVRTLAVWPRDLRKATLSNRWSRANTANTSIPTHDAVSASAKKLSRSLGSLLFGSQKETIRDVEQGVQLQPVATNASNASLGGLDPEGSLDKLRFANVQTLYKLSELTQRALLVLELNMGVLDDVSKYYSGLSEAEFSSSAAYQDIINNFLTEVKKITRKLETRDSQLKCLLTSINQSVQMYECVLQQRRNQIGDMFAEVALRSANQMQEISNKTSRETASMHVITIVTLIFLPATFVATFFQSGVFLWNDDAPPDMKESYRYQNEGFRLFLAVCGPLTAITIGTWLYVFIRLKRRAQLIK